MKCSEDVKKERKKVKRKNEKYFISGGQVNDWREPEKGVNTLLPDTEPLSTFTEPTF